MTDDQEELANARAEAVSEYRALVVVQRALQRLLNAKGLRYRDLARRLGVSEARVSHLFSDEPANLTLRTIARIFDNLDETLVVMTKREFDSAIAEAQGKVIDHQPMWHVEAPDFLVWDQSATPGLTMASEMERPVTTPTLQWALADEAYSKRKQVA